MQKRLLFKSSDNCPYNMHKKWPDCRGIDRKMPMLNVTISFQEAIEREIEKERKSNNMYVIWKIGWKCIDMDEDIYFLDGFMSFVTIAFQSEMCFIYTKYFRFFKTKYTIRQLKCQCIELCKCSVIEWLLVVWLWPFVSLFILFILWNIKINWV